uniref:RNA-directed DNA polymerase n=1 Tax=Caenorhabditis japonica TaxID=281687 RepID=A0A8R1DGL0_CAEJA
MALPNRLQSRKCTKLHSPLANDASAHHCEIAGALEGGGAVQRVRKLMREAQTGANRSEVIQVAKEAFRTGLQSDIRFYVTTARSTEFDQIYKDAIFFEKALQYKERKERADAAVIANRPRAAEVFAQAALRHQGQFYDYEDDEQSFYPAVTALNPRSGNNRPGNHQQRTPGVAFNNPSRDFNMSQNFSRSFDQIRNRNAECWYCGFSGHYRQDCRKRAADIARGIFRSSIDTPHNAPMHSIRSGNAEPRRTPLNPVENHQQPTIRVLQSTSSMNLPTPAEAASSQTVPTANTVRQVSTSFITAQVPVRANGRPCHALIDTGANITVTSEATKETFYNTPLEQPKSSTALGLGGKCSKMVGAAVIKFQIGPFKVDHLTHFTEGRCTPAGPTDYTFMIGNDVLSQLPQFVFDYANARFLIGGAILPMGNQQERDSRPGNYRLYLEENTTFPAESEQRVKGTLNKKLTNHDMVVHQQSDLCDRLGLSITPTVFRSQNALLLVTNPTRTDITVPARATIANVGRIHTAPDGSLHCSDTASDEAFPNIATTDSRLQPLDPDFKIDFNSIQCKEEERRQLKQLCEDYADVLSRNPYDLGSSKTDPVHIYTTSEVPVKSRPYRVPVKYQAELEQHINALIRSKRITESNTPWTSPIVLVKKKSGALRVCLDFRRLNDITKPDNFPFPSIDAILEKVGGARYFSSLDMANRYLQLRLDAESSYKCGFITETKVFAIWTQVSRVVFPASSENGHTITESNYTPNEANVKSIAEMSTPKNLAEIRRFVGMVGFFRKFLPNLATVAEPLTRLNRKNEKFRWETPQQEAFDTLREALLDKPILAFPDYEKPFNLFCDASAVGLGAALMQAETEEEKHFKAIAYTSRTLADSETRWPAIQVELLAIIFALRHFRPYICLSNIILHSDHRPLSYLLSKHKVNDNLARWLIKLQQYDIKIVHIDGKKNTVADYLQRMQGEGQPNETELEDIVSFSICMANTTNEHVPPIILDTHIITAVQTNQVFLLDC